MLFFFFFLPHCTVASHQRRPSKEETMSLRRSPSGLRSRWADRGIPEAYEIKVYEIDNLQRMQKRAGAGKTLPGSLGVPLKSIGNHMNSMTKMAT